ncbi:MAG: HAMP domain-containing histidine kinase [Lactobacillus sp.]|nr:HAMP domain-containing histidine kinase [Lactobacillus sp.]MCI1883840.1 HAMP domain-containing histidine kinase [Lactobacillus sp.]MCI1916222.1 HAMP domain-containing histidine kinase [Lactobacillus sp.]MCI1943498.1 HAMP domain-containing histidine kinase [Lactobacillus sp.]MCI1973373.1 HAMP domain-containing histidine kinase [Lactobacillus sp.]
MKPNKKTNKEARHISLVYKWIGGILLIIAASFAIFTATTYSVVNREFLRQQTSSSRNVVQTFRSRLVQVDERLTVSNVVPILSPNTERILQGEAGVKPSTDTDSKSDDVVDDPVLAVLSNKDLRITIYSDRGEIAFTNDNNPPLLSKVKNAKRSQVINTSSGKVLRSKAPIYSKRTHKLTGYLVVDNTMPAYNKVMRRLRQGIFIWALIALLLSGIAAYVLIISFVRPIKLMSKVARKVDEQPDSSDRIPDLHRHDELGDLSIAFNHMLDRMQAYIQQQKQFVGDVSHELRTPVAVIQGHLNMLERWGKDDPQVLDESINASLQEIDRMKHLIQEMLDLTRAEQVDIQFPNAVTKVSEVVKRVVGDMRMLHKDFLIQLDIDNLPADTQIKMYNNHLEEILIILIDNAVKYSTNRKEVDVSASVSKKRVDLVVQDFGEGISEADAKKIFDRFYRVDKARTREKGGNGLGLSIAQKLTKAYHGEIKVESAVGSGSRFELSFPLLEQNK